MPYREPVTNRIVYRLGEIGSGFKPRSLSGFHDIQKIKAACAAKGGVLFEDEEFPANNASLGCADSKAAEYIWKRPHDIVPAGSGAEFIVDDADRFDIRQGQIGNCWLLAALTDLTLNKSFIEFTLTSDNSFTKKYCGAFHFRFWQFGKWIDVTIDDRLPCYKKNGTLVFMHSEEKSEFWGPLLEKAYAKLRGSYEALSGGFTFEGLEDFTGGYTEIFLLSSLVEMKLVKSQSELFDLMTVAQKSSSFMGSSVKTHKNKREQHLANGLVAGHAYSITDLRRIKVKKEVAKDKYIELLRLRNPWGNAVEWNGDFSDNSPRWNEYFYPEDITDVGLTFRADGEFWMTITDYLEQFERIEVCHVLPFEQKDDEEVTKHGDQVVHCKMGQWTKGVTAGGPFLLGSDLNPSYETNPQYLLTVGKTPKNKPTTVIVALMKNDRRIEGDCNVKSFGFDIFDVSKDDPEKLPRPLDSDFFDETNPIDKMNPPGKTTREKTVRFHLIPGQYIIVPSTEEPGCHGQYLLRVITTGESTLEAFDKTLHKEDEKVEVEEMSTERAEELKKYKQFFDDVAEEDEQVDWWELKMLLDKTFHNAFRYEGFGFSEDECRALVALYDSDFTGKLDFYEFMKLWLNIIKWKAVFDKFAAKQDGVCSLRAPDLDNAFQDAGYSVSTDVVARIILRYGDRNGQIWLSKFIVAAVKLEAVFGQFKRMDVDSKKQTMVTFDVWLTSTIYS